MRRVGIRREDKDVWEARVPLVPSDVEALLESCELTMKVQPSQQRVFADDAFAAAGAIVTEDLSDCEIVLAVKEIPNGFFEPGTTYVFFSHTIKGQPYNMPMLRRMMELGCQLIDYERITDEAGSRLISFSRYAGLAGAVDTLWALGRRLAWEGLEPNPFASLGQTYTYDSLESAMAAVRECGRRLAAEGVPAELSPFVVGITGYGRVSLGAQEIIDALDPIDVAPDDLAALAAAAGDGRRVYKVVFREQDMVSRRAEATAGAGSEDAVTREAASALAAFDLDEYYRSPERYEARFARFLPSLSVLVNAIYWEERYPRLVTKADLKALWTGDGRPRLTVVGDITCDIGGSVEFTVKETQVGDPVYVWDPVTGEAIDGVAGRGPVVMAVGNLPCELSRDASESFSRTLATLMPDLLAADLDVPFERLELSPELKRALILHRGELTPDYAYLRRFL